MAFSSREPPNPKLLDIKSGIQLHWLWVCTTIWHICVGMLHSGRVCKILFIHSCLCNPPWTSNIYLPLFCISILFTPVNTLHPSNWRSTTLLISKRGVIVPSITKFSIVSLVCLNAPVVKFCRHKAIEVVFLDFGKLISQFYQIHIFPNSCPQIRTCTTLE